MDRVVVHKPAGSLVWLVQTEAAKPRGKGPRKVLEVEEFEKFPDAHEAANQKGVPVYVPKYAYDPLEDEPGWDLPDGAPHAVVDEHVQRMVGPRP